MCRAAISGSHTGTSASCGPSPLYWAALRLSDDHLDLQGRIAIAATANEERPGVWRQQLAGRLERPQDWSKQSPKGHPSRMAVSHSYFRGDGLNNTGYIDDYAYATAAKQSSKARTEFTYSRSANPFLAPPPNLKACTQCGTTRTPQWREGPEGPKTLCNACGVKRVRAMRLASGEAGPAKRRSSGDRPAPHAALPPKTMAALSLGKQSSGSLTSDSHGIGRKRARSPSASGRPQRKAAVKAASRTAEFATTGDWPEEEEAMYPTSPIDRSLSPSASDDSAALNSDSAEEVAWTPARGPAYHPAVPLPPSPMPMVGHETAAAVNLLSMSIREADLAASRAAAAGAYAHRSSPPALQSEQHPQVARSPCNLSSPGFAAMLSAAVNSSSVRDDGQQAAEQAREALQDTLRGLPANKQVDMCVLKEAYDSSIREAAAADAAVAAVAKILAIKQAAAIKARAGASVAANAMHSWIVGLDDEYSWSRACKMRQERP